MKINMDQELIKALLMREDFFNKVPEYFYLKETGSKVFQALTAEGGCPACVENNLINPSIGEFMSHTINMYLDCGEEATSKLKSFIKAFKNINEDFNISVFYKESDEADIVELLI